MEFYNSKKIYIILAVTNYTKGTNNWSTDPTNQYSVYVFGSFIVGLDIVMRIVDDN